jgi:ribonucleoside-diphosphate reductase beta chain
MMIKTLAWQWEADSVASRAIAPVLAPFITSSELWACWQRISDNEVVHAATYSEIVRNSFDDPAVILDEILRVQQAHERLREVARVFAEGYEASHRYALGQLPNDQNTYNAVFMTIVGLFCMERIQFLASFAVTFAICDTGLFQPIGKAIQKIAQDELEIHAELDRAVLLNELQTERGQAAFTQCHAQIEALIEEVIDSELRWIDYLFSEGRELVGMTAERLSAWTLYCAKDVYQTLGLTARNHTLPASNPLKFMEKWLNISKTQASPQEQDIAAYKVGVMRRTDQDVVFDDDF